jgi:hypothetical protein
LEGNSERDWRWADAGRERRRETNEWMDGLLEDWGEGHSDRYIYVYVYIYAD